jgi:hypothetical protein
LTEEVGFIFRKGLKKEETKNKRQIDVPVRWRREKNH